MDYRIDITEPAERDMFEILTYITETLKEPLAAKRIYRTIRDEILSLSFMPLRYPVIPEQPYRKADVRKLVVENYIVFYLVSGDTVTVLRVLYNRREWHTLLNESL